MTLTKKNKSKKPTKKYKHKNTTKKYKGHVRGGMLNRLFRRGRRRIAPDVISQSRVTFNRTPTMNDQEEREFNIAEQMSALFLEKEILEKELEQCNIKLSEMESMTQAGSHRPRSRPMSRVHPSLGSSSLDDAIQRRITTLQDYTRNSDNLPGVLHHLGNRHLHRSQNETN